MEVSQEQADWLPFRLGCQVVIIGLNDKGCQVVTPLPPPHEFRTLLDDKRNWEILSSLLMDDQKPVMLGVNWKPGEYFAAITIVPADLRADDGEEVPLETFELPFRRS
jgi:hypothetical protein